MPTLCVNAAGLKCQKHGMMRDWWIGFRNVSQIYGKMGVNDWNILDTYHLSWIIHNLWKTIVVSDMRMCCLVCFHLPFLHRSIKPLRLEHHPDRVIARRPRRTLKGPTFSMEIHRLQRTWRSKHLTDLHSSGKLKHFHHFPVLEIGPPWTGAARFRSAVSTSAFGKSAGPAPRISVTHASSIPRTASGKATGERNDQQPRYCNVTVCGVFWTIHRFFSIVRHGTEEAWTHAKVTYPLTRCSANTPTFVPTV